VLALLPTATENILDALPVEAITNELQQQRAEKLGRSAGTSEIAPSELSSGAKSGMGDDGKSQTSFQTDEFLHTSQMASSANEQSSSSLGPRKTKHQLWDELKINCGLRPMVHAWTVC
jgi:peroxin-3